MRETEGGSCRKLEGDTAVVFRLLSPCCVSVLRRRSGVTLSCVLSNRTEPNCGEVLDRIELNQY